MANGFFLGGLAQGFDSGLSAAGNLEYQKGLMQIAQQREQNNQLNQQRTFYLDLRQQAITHLGDHIEQLLLAHPNMTALQVTNDPAVIGLRDRLSGFDKNLGLDPNEASSIVAEFASRPSKAVTEAAEARAKEGPLGQQLKLSEINKNRTIAGQNPIDIGGQPANPTNPDLDTNTQLGGKQFKSTGNKQADSILKGIDNGDTPPDLKGLYGKNKTAILAGAEDNGINIAQKQLQWERARKLTQSLNSSQMTRYAGLNESVINTIDEVNGLAKQMQLSGIPILNQAQLTRLIQTQGNSAEGQLAAKYIGAVNTLKEEFANLAQGGYAPTEPAWKLANEQINGNYGVQELGASLGEVQKLIKIRYNAIPGITTLGPTAPNQYTGTGEKKDQGITVHGFTFTPSQ